MTPADKPAKRAHTLRVVVSDDEKARIEALARQTQLSVSTFMRNVSLGQRVRSVLDEERVVDLLRLKGEIGRCGGVLILWIKERPEDAASVEEVRAVLHQLERLADEVRQKVRQL